jgi:hypothetical protein
MTRLPLLILLGAAAVCWSPGRALHAQAERVPIVAVTGCLGEQGTTWILTNATEPVPSVANAPAAGQPMAGPTSGKNQYRLIGVSEFDLPSHRGHTVLVKGLLVKAAAETRVNVTSVTMVSPTCTPPPKI